MPEALPKGMARCVLKFAFIWQLKCAAPEALPEARRFVFKFGKLFFQILERHIRSIIIGDSKCAMPEALPKGMAL